MIGFRSHSQFRAALGWVSAVRTAEGLPQGDQEEERGLLTQNGRPAQTEKPKCLGWALP